MAQPGTPVRPTLQVVDPRRLRRRRQILAAAWAGSVALAFVIGRYVLLPGADTLMARLVESQAALAEYRQRLSEVEQHLANVERAEQIARLGNENVQRTLAQREAELADLRRQLTLYERLIGPQAQRHPLTVQELNLRQDEAGYAFSVLLTQTQDVRRGSEGRLKLSVEGLGDGRPQRLPWNDLVPPDASEGLPYDFRYFQRVEGRIILPDGFLPHTIHVELRGRNGETVQRSLPWQQALTQGTN